MIIEVVLTQIQSVSNLKLTNVLEVRKWLSFFATAQAVLSTSCVKQGSAVFSSDVHPLLELLFL